jgi:hypothetical protein
MGNIISAVDWLVEEFKKQGFLYDLDIEQAKQIETELILKAYNEGINYGICCGEKNDDE